MTAQFYQGQTDYIQKLNELATTNQLIDIEEGLEQVDAAVIAANASAEYSASQASISSTKAAEASDSAASSSDSASTAISQAGIATNKASEASISADEAEYWASQSHADQIQADWTQSNTASVDFIQNKPSLGSASLLNVPSSGDASNTQVVKGDDTRLVDARPINISGSSNGQVLMWSGGSWSAQTIVQGLINFSESLSTSSPNNIIYSVKLTPNTISTNSDIVVSPKGTGSILANTADGTGTGGNKRGQNASDFQQSRSSATMIASGNYSGILAGINNTSSGLQAVVLGGTTNTASGTNSTVVSGNTNSNSGTASFIGGGTSNTLTTSNNSAVVSGNSNIIDSNAHQTIICGGQQNRNYGSSYGFIGGGISNVILTTSPYSVIVGGQGNYIDASHGSILGGKFGTTRGIIGTYARGCVASTNYGTTQKTEYLLAGTTTNTTPLILSTDGNTSVANNSVIMPDNSSYHVTLQIIARNTTTGAAATWSGKALFTRVSGAASVTRVGGSITADYNTSGFTPGVPTILADTSLGCIKITVTGIASTNIQWFANLDILEVSV